MASSRRHRPPSDFHLACPYTSLPLCRCRLYVRTPALWALDTPNPQNPSVRADPRENARQLLLGAIARGGAHRCSSASVSSAFARAVHRRANRSYSRNATMRNLAALMDAAETEREDAALRTRLTAAEIAEAARAAEAKRLRDEARRQREEELAEARRAAEPEPAPAPVSPRVPRNDRDHFEPPSAEEQARIEAAREADRERARIRKRERDRERRRLKKLERERNRRR